MNLCLPTFEGIGRSVDCRPGLVTPHVGDSAKNLLAGRIDDINGCFRTRIPPVAADQRLLAKQIPILQCNSTCSFAFGPKPAIAACAYVPCPRASLLDEGSTSALWICDWRDKVVSSEQYRIARRIFHRE